uniref:Uncharacterized protein n=1 Tax=Anguilla anguilla TaxID=7936 RepID=A0A0E9SJV6_ANGAN
MMSLSTPFSNSARLVCDGIY